MDIELRNRYLFSQELVKEVGKVALDFYLNRKELKIECKKGDLQDQVSIADKTVEAKIKDALKQHFPQDGFLGEESGAENLACEYCWVVDELLRALKCDVAVLNAHPIHVSSSTSLKEGLMGLGVSHRVHPDTFTPVLHQILLDGGMFIRNGSGALMLVYVAAGRLIGYFEPHINAWDVCAAIIIVQEAGGCVNNFLENDGLLKGNYILGCCSEAVFTRLNHIKNSHETQ